MEHGKYTKKLGENLIGVLKESLGVKVFHDHGGKDALTKLVRRAFDPKQA